MEEDAKTRLKWKFYRLTIELNIIILLVATPIIVFIFFMHIPYSVPLIIGLLILALILSLDIFKKFNETKKWLDEQSEKDKKDEGTRQDGTI
jgi:hypothetical protein